MAECMRCHHPLDSHAATRFTDGRVVERCLHNGIDSDDQTICPCSGFLGIWPSLIEERYAY